VVAPPIQKMVQKEVGTREHDRGGRKERGDSGGRKKGGTWGVKQGDIASPIMQRTKVWGGAFGRRGQTAYNKDVPARPRPQCLRIRGRKRKRHRENGPARKVVSTLGGKRETLRVKNNIYPATSREGGETAKKN